MYDFSKVILKWADKYFINKQYKERKTIMKHLLTNQIYSAGKNQQINIAYLPNSKANTLDFTGYPWCDHSWQLVIGRLLRWYPTVLHDSDLLAHDDYISELLQSGNAKVLLVYTGKASKKRLQLARAKLKAAGIKVRYFASMNAFNKYNTAVKK